MIRGTRTTSPVEILGMADHAVLHERLAVVRRDDDDRAVDEAVLFEHVDEHPDVVVGPVHRAVVVVGEFRAESRRSVGEQVLVRIHVVDVEQERSILAPFDQRDSEVGNVDVGHCVTLGARAVMRRCDRAGLGRS